MYSKFESSPFLGLLFTFILIFSPFLSEKSISLPNSYFKAFGFEFLRFYQEKYSLLRSLYYWKTTPKSNASFLSLKATPTHKNPPVGFLSLTAYPLELSEVFTIASL